MNGQSFSPRFVPLSYTYNAFGQMLSATGPRTDVVDTTTYTYDASTGNLTRMTDAVGNKTTFVATARVSHR